VNRLSELKKQFKSCKIDSFLITNINNVRYLSGFSGSAGKVLLTQSENYFISDFRYQVQSENEVYDDFKIIIFTQNSDKFLRKLINKHKLKRIGFESSYMTVESASGLKSDFSDVKFVPLSQFVESVTMIKTEEEINTTRKAVEITDKTFSEILKLVKPGITEKEISAEISYIQKKFGADGDSFDPIVASGERSAFPHARATDKVIKNNELLKLDFGCSFEGLKSDLTRTIAIGKINDECKKIYNIVKDAQRIALDNAREGISAKKLDSFARDYITKKGYGKNFGHGLGHGLGYNIHEGPSLNPRTNYKLKINNIVTIEPGIYIEGLGGVRIEDDVVIKANDCVVLNTSTKDLISI
jgi:Xaa-Pro aminopeptidase